MGNRDVDLRLHGRLKCLVSGRVRLWNKDWQKRSSGTKVSRRAQGRSRFARNVAVFKYYRNDSELIICMPPKISIVTPSFNQGQFIEETIRSVLDQNYPNLEYLVIDGGSTDQTIEIIRKYEAQFSYWETEKDRGQVHAINKGLARATGDIFAFINSDDIYLPRTFATVAKYFDDHPSAEWICGDT